MTKDQVFTSVCKTVREVIEDYEVVLSSETTLAELGIDSIDMADLTCLLEHEFNLRRLRDDWPGETTLGQLVDHCIEAANWTKTLR